jgi:hypothetical protein
MEGKRLAIAALLIIVVIIAVIFTAKRMTGAPPPPARVLNEKVQKIDYKTSELETEAVRDWIGKYAPDASGRYKSPKTGEYTMVDTVKCVACGELIPGVQIPDELQKPPQAPAPTSGDKDLPPPPHAGKIDPAIMTKLRQEYRCPKCGKYPYMF